MTTVKHKHKMPASHKKELLMILLVGGIIGVVLHYVLNWTDTNGMYVTFGIFSGLALLQLFLGVRRRSNTTIIAELDDTKWKASVWMNREIPMWNKLLTKYTNTIQLTDIDRAYVKDMNNNHTLVIQNKINRGMVYIPARIAHTPEFKAFVSAFLDSEDSKYLDKESRKVIENFMDGVKA